MSDIKCTVDQCEKTAYCLGLCRSHYSLARRMDQTRPKCKNCDRVSETRGLCKKCYELFRKTSEFKTVRGLGLAFLKNLGNTEECILWPFGIQGDGYGIQVFKGSARTAHSVSLELRTPKPFPRAIALHASHEICGNRLCVNPAHLRWGTDADNARDCINDGNYAKKLTIDQVAQIRSLGNSMSQRAIGKVFGVSQTTIYEIQKRRTWV